jgi:hypothetical protein
MAAATLLAASALVILAMGLLHLLYTFHGTQLHPRDAQLVDALKAASPVISRRTTMWKAWIGFNASHSFGAILFGAVYGYLALVHAEFLFRSTFLLGLGLLLLLAYALVARRYWFSAPWRGILLATLLYAGGLLAAFA